MIRTVVWCSVLLLLPAMGSAGEKEDLAEEILILTGVPHTADIAVDQMMKVYDGILKNAETGDVEKAKAAELESRARRLIREELSWETIRESYVALYAETYTLEELKGMARFYRSEVGQSILKKLPAVTEKVMAITQERMRGIIPKLAEMIEGAEKSRR